MLIERAIKILLYSISFLFVFALSLFFIIPLMNNYKLNNFASQVESIPLPDNLILVEKKAICGKLIGNGNGMDFLVAILVESNLSEQFLTQYFTNRPFKPAKNIEGHKVIVEVSSVKNDKIKGISGELHPKVSFSTLDTICDYSKYYIVIFFDGGYSADFDIRGH